ncbi:MAG: hypothetical protein H6867_00140 [Rhodospirillales bacterium]|nr:hypothetical protein [Rhodospirillales bacterium]MCB9996932.1 hypothetical protein [Rhodospirillales bacterium]
MTNNKEKGQKPMVRSSRDIKQSLLRRAFAENRGAEMIERIQHHVNRARQMPLEHAYGLKLAQLFDERCGTSKTLRSLSLRTGAIWEDNSLKNEALPVEDESFSLQKTQDKGPKPALVH